MFQIRRDRYYKIATDKDTGLGGETMFEFKHVPKISRTTRLGKRTASKPAKQGIETLGHMGLFGTVAAVAVLCSWIIFLVQHADLSQAFLRIENEMKLDSLSKSFSFLERFA